MMETLNQSLFLMINATPESPAWLLQLATFIAKDLILIVPILGAVMWFWGAPEQMKARRKVVFKVAVAIVVGLFLSWIIGQLFPHERPFASGIGYNFLHHKPNNSFPSNHGTIIFTFALGFLFWHRLWSGIVLLAVGVAIAWSRVYLGVHWPLDMVGGFILALICCAISQLIWYRSGVALLSAIVKVYRIVFGPLIRKGWIHN